MLAALGSLIGWPRGPLSPSIFLISLFCDGFAGLRWLARRPGHVPTAQNVPVDVEHRLARVAARVEYEAKFAVTLIFSDLGSQGDHLRSEEHTSELQSRGH